MKTRKILLCVSGGIAAYKAAALTSKLTQAGYEVKVIMTLSATKFISPLTFQALSRNEVYTDTFIENNPKVIAHIDVADWPDLVLVAPATANTIGKLANGIADDMLTTTLLATTAPIWIAPAMNVHMYSNSAVQQNMKTLAEYGYRFIEPGEGYLACGYVGKGRLEEPETIVQLVQSHFSMDPAPLTQKRILITAGPTKEKIDPVRYLTNHSSGKMGYALAEEAAKMGAEVILISGADSLETPSGVALVKVESAEEMYNEVMRFFPDVDIVIKSAAVADYRPISFSEKKLKKKEGNLVIELERTKDILSELGISKKQQFLVGFAAETNNIEHYAMDKLQRKNADMIVANDITAQGAGFKSDTNIVTIFHKDKTKKQLPLLSKRDTAREILQEIVLKMGDEKQK